MAVYGRGSGENRARRYKFYVTPAQFIQGAASIPTLPIPLDTLPGVETWWATHPFNADANEYVPYIGRTDGGFTAVNNGDDLQEAIDAANDGTVFVLNSGSYGDIELVGRNNLYFIAEQKNTVEISGIEMYAGEAARDYTQWYTDIRNDVTAAVNLANNRPSGVLFRNITFNGNGRLSTISDNTVYNSAVMIRGYSDVIFEDCTFTGYLRPDPMVWSPAVINGNGLIDNIWVRRCTFDCPGSHETFYMDGLHGGGVVYSSFGNVYSQRVHLNTNKDFTADLDGDTVFEIDEMRNTKYAAFINNSIEISNVNIGEVFHIAGAHILIDGNVVSGTNIINQFVKARAWEAYDFQTADFANLELIIQNNTCGVAKRFLYIFGDTDPSFDGIGTQHVGSVGQYQVINNVITSGQFDENVTEVPTITGPNVVSGNTVL